MEDPHSDTDVGLITCPACGEANPDRFRLCSFCGTPLSLDRVPDLVRRVVTIVQSDLKGSTALGERLDPESLREVLTRYFDEMRVVFEGHGGTIEKIIGDAIVAVFGLPIGRDDDPVRAVEAAWESVLALAALNDRLELEWGVRLVNRTGVATGEVTVGEASGGQHVLTGDVVRHAVAMEQSCRPLGVLLADSTFALVADAVEAEPAVTLTLKGMDETVVAHQLTRLLAPEERGPIASALTAAARAALPASSDARACPACGAENPERGRICGMCGGSLAVTAKTHETRRTVTLVFADPKPTSLTGGQPDPAALKDVMTRYFDEMRRILERHGATVEKFIGDAVMAVFGIPVRHEDDALRAVRAALDMQQALPALNDEFVARHGIELLNHIGVNTGEVVAGDASVGQRLVSGDAVNVAARLEQAANAREVLIGPLTYGLVRAAVEVEDVEPLTLKGKSEPFAAYRLIAVRSAEQGSRARETPMVGREEEMAALRRGLHDAGRTGRPRLVTVIGDAGVGKTRLVREFLGGVSADSLVIKGRCLPYGDGITFWPLIDMVRRAAAIRDDDPHEYAIGRIAGVVGRDDAEITDRIASVIGLSTTTYQIAELFWAIRRFFETLARDAPLVVVFDDIHWAEETLLELIRHIVGTASAPILLLCTARTELLESQTDWGEGDRQARLVLVPLSQNEAGKVVQNLLGGAGLSDAVAARIVEAAEGNPLFVEQVLSMLVDNGTLQFEGGAWRAVGDLSQLAIPPTVHALVAARLDALPGDERAVVDPASVIGLTFAEPAVEVLVDETDPHEVPALLARVARKQMIRPASGVSATPESYRFQHLVIRDAAYQGLLKRSRALLHERFVEWADRVNAEQDRALEFEEVLGYHLEQAYLYRTQLGPLDEHGVTLGIRASQRLHSAGDRALARGDLPAATGLLTRAAALLPSVDLERARILTKAGGARMESGQFEAADEAFGEAIAIARENTDETLALTIEMDRLYLHYLTGTAGSDDEVLATTMRAIDQLAAAGADDGLARAYRLRGSVELTAGRWAATEEAAALLIEHAGRAGNALMRTRSLPNLANLAIYAPTPVSEGLRRCEELLPQVASDRRASAVVLRAAARLHAMAGDFERARREYREARRTYVELGWNFDAATCSLDGAAIELLAGNAAAAERELREDLRTLRDMGDRNWSPATASLLALSLIAQGRHEEAGAFARMGEADASPEDIFTQVLWRRARSEILMAAHEPTQGLTKATEAVELARGSDDPTQLADSLVTLGGALQAVSRCDDARVALLEALTLYDAKENTAAAAAVRAAWPELSQRPPDRVIPAQGVAAS